MDPTLPPAETLAELARALPAHRALGAWTPLPGGRVNRLWQQGDLVLKIYDPAGASPLFANDPRAEAAALRHTAPHGLAPELRAEGAGWVAYAHVPGTTWQSDVTRVAGLLAKLHALPLPQDPAIPIQAQDWPFPPCLIHGDPVPGNILVQRDQALLIDWQCPALGDPAHDLALFLSPAMQRLYAGKSLSRADHDLFLMTYPNRETVARYQTQARPLHRRIADHCLWRAARSDPGYAEAARAELALL
jgi:thiamine kinase